MGRQSQPRQTRVAKPATPETTAPAIPEAATTPPEQRDDATNPDPAKPEDTLAVPPADPEPQDPEPASRMVRFLVGVGGLHYSYTPGQIYELPEEEAAKWADGERAEYAD